MAEFILEVAHAMGLAASDASALTCGGSTSFYPSTERGPVATGLCRARFGAWWTPTPLRDAVRRSVSFLEEGMRQGWNTPDCEEVVRSVCEDLGVDGKRARRAFVGALVQHYGTKLRPWKKKKKKNHGGADKG